MNAALPLAAAGYVDAQGRLLPARVRADFPILGREVHGRPLAYLDSAASAQQPRAVLDAVTRYGELHHANVHRGVHTLSQEATAAFEGARETVRRFINARSTREIVFTRGTTEAINLVAQAWGGTQLRAGDEVLVTQLEHHANIVPWQMACERAGARLVAVPLNAAGEVELDAFAACLGPRTRLVALAHVSNALGTVLPVKAMIGLARARGLPVLVDGAQAIAHQRVDVQALDCDFYAFSGHKVYGPTGIGVLYGREQQLAALPPWQGGGDMILTVAIERSTYNELPWKFEAGTPNISGAVGLAAALDYVEMLGRERIAAHEQHLLHTATAQLREVAGLTLVGTAADKAGVISFTLKGIHPHDIGTILDREGVAIRTGHHCAMPVMTWYGLSATARASFGCYNTEADIERLLVALDRVREVFA
ncbi:MAG: cysteine desulfurase [Proteobacteria bacterium]|nr:cysteine desulfurase [Pseudomonadota bacterium]